MVAQPDLAVIKEGQQAAWAAGDFSMFATTITIVSETLCETVDVRAGQRVLDVATGSGNTAIAAARRGCEVTGVDYVPAVLERGRMRAAVERLDVTFVEGDAEDLPFPDESFDVVLSTFGVMFAPHQERAAAELLRVCRPGGKIGLANFPPESLAGGFFRTAARYKLPPRGVRAPVLWGTEDRLVELFGDEVSSITLTPRAVHLRYRSAAHWFEFFRQHFGPIGLVHEGLEPGKRERFANDLMELVSDANRSGDDTIKAPVGYVDVVITKRESAASR
ncbi:MAG TPA: class I SAM-dependent methyltransferase [Actinomycetota bacterium]